jgi:glycosyltransferase involved in cell wall biosynthesis
VSIGMPVYNAERYLEQAIESILAQTLDSFELIICDNASSDRTEQMCRAYASRDRRIKYHRNETNLGAAPNFNRTFELASARYFKWAPYDDAIDPDYLRACVNVLDDNPDVVLCYTRARIIDESGSYVVDYDPGPETRSPRRHENYGNLILRPEYALQLMNVIRADTLRETKLHGSFPSSDEVLLAELAMRGRFFEVSDRLYIYRRHPEQSTKQPKARQRAMFMDTSLKGRIVLPTWRYFLACESVIRRATSSISESLWCYAHLCRWALMPPHFRALGKDLLIAVGQLVRRWRAGVIPPRQDQPI